MSLHTDPTGPNQDPRGKMGDLGNSFWHDYWTSMAITKNGRVWFPRTMG